MNLLNQYSAYSTGQLLFWVFSTMACNAACSYCKVHDLSRPDLTLSKSDFMQIHYLQQKYAKTRNEWVNPLWMITGGEPLLTWSEWREFFETTPCRKTVITNLVNLPEGFLPWYKRTGCGITPSCDGFIGKPLKDGTNTSPMVMENLLALKDYEIPHSIQSVLNDETSTESYLDFADWIIDHAGNTHWKTNIDTNISDPDLLNKKVHTLCALIKHLHKRKIKLYKTHGKRQPNVISIDFCGVDAINTNQPGCLCGCGHNLYGLGKTSKGISLFRCNCTNEESMSLGLLENFSESVMDHEYGYREKFRKWCEGCPIARHCGGNCKCGENTRSQSRDFYCEAKIKIIKCLFEYYFANGLPK